MDVLTANEVALLNRVYCDSRPMGLGSMIQEIITAVNAGMGPVGPQGAAGAQGVVGPQGAPGPCTEILADTPVNAVSASETLAISGVVINGETVTIDNPEVEGTDVYEFASSVALVVGAGNIPVDINAHTVKATDNLTVDVNPIAGETMTLGTKVYTFVPLGTANADGEIDIEVLLADTQANIVAAIKGTDGHNDPHSLVTCGAAFAANILAITAIYGGAAGNDIATTETFNAGTNVFSAAKLATGANCSATNAVTALVAAITASDTQGVGAADGADDTVVLASDAGGVIANTIVIAEDMANGAFTADAVLLSGGVDGTPGDERTIFMDSSYLYICVADNDVTGKNWRRISLGNVY